MDFVEQQRAAEYKAASLNALGWEAGAGAAIWARAITDELARHDAARKRFEEQSADREAWERLHGSALVIVVAIAQVLAFERRVRKLTGDAELARARAAFDVRGSRARAVRDVAAHLDEYAVGSGRRQRGAGRPGERPVTERHVKPFVYWTDSGDTFLDLGGENLNLHATARAAVALAEVVERVRGQHLILIERRANEALRRRHGLC